ncbi:MAG TPA: glycosyltransferase family 2 protein [Methanocellaceae archaeon]
METVEKNHQQNLKIKGTVSDLISSVNDGLEGSIKRSLNKPFILVGIPAFNEEVAIGSMVLRARKYADKVIVIDDGSMDKTADVAMTAGAHVVPRRNNSGKGAAIKDAFEYAKKVKADILVLIDGDGQHNPDEIPLLLAPIIKGEADIVNGSRFLNNNKNNVPAYRRVGQEVLTFATNFGTKTHITDTQNGFRAFSRKTFECFSFKQNGMAIESEMLMDAARAKMRISEVPIDVRYDVAGSTYNPVVHGLSVLGRVISLVSQSRPLIFFCVPGAILLTIGLAAAFLTFDEFNITRNISVSYAMITSSCVILGITSMFTGFILNAIQGIK